MLALCPKYFKSFPDFIIPLLAFSLFYRDTLDFYVVLKFLFSHFLILCVFFSLSL